MTKLSRFNYYHTYFNKVFNNIYNKVTGFFLSAHNPLITVTQISIRLFISIDFFGNSYCYFVSFLQLKKRLIDKNVF